MERTDPNFAGNHARTLAQAASDLAHEVGPSPTTDRICELAVELIAACDHASITIRGRRRRPETLAASSELAVELDQSQYAMREGPNLTVIDVGGTIVSNDLARDPRWVTWRQSAVRQGIRSLLCVRLMASGDPIGAITLYSGSIDAWDEAAIELAELYATHAAIAMNSSRVADGLHTALASRHLIGLAQGILMARHQLGATQAFAVLQRYSSESNAKVVDIARELVADLDVSYDAPPTAG